MAGSVSVAGSVLVGRQGRAGRVEQLDSAVAVAPAPVARPVDQREVETGVAGGGVGRADLRRLGAIEVRGRPWRAGSSVWLVTSAEPEVGQD